MCLVICTNKHKRDETGHYIPFVAEQDIHVYKQLSHNWLDGKKYYTPYRVSPVNFKNGICEMSSKNFSYRASDSYSCVYHGIHARRTKTMDGIPFRGLHHAIIPKGTQYFLGRMNDIVALKVIIFKDETDYEKYCKENNTSPKSFSHLWTHY